MTAGIFGELTVRDEQGERQLLLNQQVQGGCFLSPGANIVDPRLSGPGPISSSTYALGWLAAGYQAPHSQVLMIGLGSGAGAVQMLWQFPWIELTIVEACTTTIELAKQAFPLIGHYQAEGRLHLRIGLAQDVLGSSTLSWDLGLADAYTGDGQASELQYLDELVDRSEHVYLNVIDIPDGRHLAQAVDRLMAADKPVVGLYRAADVQRVDETYRGHTNWILTTADQQPDRLLAYRPFDGQPGQGGLWGRANWEPFVRSFRHASLSDVHVQR